VAHDPAHDPVPKTLALVVWMNDDVLNVEIDAAIPHDPPAADDLLASVDAHGVL